MVEFLVHIDPEKHALVKELIEELGGNMSEVKAKKDKAKKKAPSQKISPTFLFGKWKDFPLDPVTYRDTLWPKRN